MISHGNLRHSNDKLNRKIIFDYTEEKTASETEIFWFSKCFSKNDSKIEQVVLNTINHMKSKGNEK